MLMHKYTNTETYTHVSAHTHTRMDTNSRIGPFGMNFNGVLKRFGVMMGSVMGVKVRGGWVVLGAMSVGEWRSVPVGSVVL